jgi:putative ABC transport system ATP-binding protein
LSTPLIELQQVTKTYGQGEAAFSALKDVDLSLQPEEMIAIMGASGAGKSTMLHLLGLLDRPSQGHYYLSGHAVATMDDTLLAKTRNQHIGFVFQSFFLLPRFSALKNIMMPLVYRKTLFKEAKQKALDMLDKMDIRRLATHLPHEMSGGQQQRVALARALIGDPSLILADEPTGALDSKTGQTVMDLLIHLNQTEKKTIIVVTHDAHIAAQCQREIHLADGQITHENQH